MRFEPMKPAPPVTKSFILWPSVGFPGSQRVLDCLLHRLHLNTCGKQLGCIKNTVGSGGFCAEGIKLRVVGPKFKFSRGLQNASEDLDYLSGADEAGIGDIIDAKRRAPFPQIQAGPDELAA